MSEKSDGQPPETGDPKGAMPQPRNDEEETERILPVYNQRPRAVYTAPELRGSADDTDSDEPDKSRLKIEKIIIVPQDSGPSDSSDR